MGMGGGRMRNTCSECHASAAIVAVYYWPEEWIPRLAARIALTGRHWHLSR